MRSAVLKSCVDQEATKRAQGETAHHPLSLGLCADAIAAERARGCNPDPAMFALRPGDFAELASRFLKSLQNDAMERWITRLAQTPRFDEAAARAAFSPVRDVHQDAAWCALGDYSFVQEAEERGWLKLHAQMGDALRCRMARKPDALRRTHSDWQAHWQSRSSQETDDFAALAWYHLYQLDPEKARRIWNERVEHARRTAQMGVHFALLEWWTPTGIETHISVGRNDAAALNILGVELVEATFRNRAANLARAIACYEHALSIYTPEAAPFEYAMTQNNLGIAYAELPVGDRAANLQKAISCYEHALSIFTPEAAPANTP